jgi:hypothetical protein
MAWDETCEVELETDFAVDDVCEPAICFAAAIVLRVDATERRVALATLLTCDGAVTV